LTPPRVSTIILNWNDASDTLICLDSVLRSDYPNCQILVVDNGSTDDSVSRIRAAYPWIELLETGENLGYAGGNNVGIRHALEGGAEYVCILNNDVVVAPDFLTPLLAVLEGHPEVGVATPLIAEMAAPERVWALGSVVDRYSGHVRRLHAGEQVAALRQQLPAEVEVASGAAMLVRREVLNSVGLLDDKFFLYYEETDWCLRVTASGYRIVAVPSSLILHKVSAALGESSPIIDYYMLRNHLRLVGRHWSGLQRVLVEARIVLRSLLTIAAYTVKPHGGLRTPHRNARLVALRDALLGRWGKMGADVAELCCPEAAR